MKKKPAKRRIRYDPGLLRESLTIKELRDMHKKALKDNGRHFKEVLFKTMESHPRTFRLIPNK